MIHAIEEGILISKITKMHPTCKAAIRGVAV